MQELKKGLDPMMQSVKVVADDIFTRVSNSLQKGQGKLEDLLAEMEKEATKEGVQEERVVWTALEKVLTEQYSSYPDDFFEGLAKMKTSPHVAGVAKKILDQRRAKKPEFAMDAELSALWLTYTGRAQEAVRLAAKEARNMKHNFVSTSHLMSGLIREGTGVGAHVMKQVFKVDHAKLIQSIKNNMDGLEVSSDQELKLTNRARATLFRAKEEADSRKDTKVGTEHILLALTGEMIEGTPQSPIRQLTGPGSNIDPQQIRNEVERLLALPSAASTARRNAPPTPSYGFSKTPPTEICGEPVEQADAPPAAATPTASASWGDINPPKPKNVIPDGFALSIADKLVKIDIRGKDFAILVFGRDQALLSSMNIEEIEKTAGMLKVEIAFEVERQLKEKGLI